MTGMTSVRFPGIGTDFNNFRGAKLTQLVCNEDRVIKKDFVIYLQGLRCLLLCCKMIFKKFDDLCANENGMVIKDPHFS